MLPSSNRISGSPEALRVSLDESLSQAGSFSARNLVDRALRMMYAHLTELRQLLADPCPLVRANNGGSVNRMTEAESP